MKRKGSGISRPSEPPRGRPPLTEDPGRDQGSERPSAVAFGTGLPIDCLGKLPGDHFIDGQSASFLKDSFLPEKIVDAGPHMFSAHGFNSTFLSANRATDKDRVYSINGNRIPVAFSQGFERVWEEREQRANLKNGQPAGAKAQVHLAALAARVNSCPDTILRAEGVFPQHRKSCFDKKRIHERWARHLRRSGILEERICRG